MKRYARLAPVLVCLTIYATVGTEAAADSLPFTGSLIFELATDRADVPITVFGAGVATREGADPGPHLATLTLPGSSFGATGVLAPVTDVVGAFPIAELKLTVHALGGQLVGSAVDFRLAGVARLCMFAQCPTAPSNLSVPLSVVGGGTATATGGGIDVTVIGAPWTTGTASFGTQTRMGFARGPESGTSSTALPSGTIQLVTPIFLSTSLPNDPVFASFATLALHFAPEPGSLLLLATGMAVLGERARRKRR